MLRLRTLTMYNFGPYYGRHTIDIKEDNGVVFVWGENGFGKTSILNAFRFVLWNQILSRTHKLVSAYKYVNIRSIEENDEMYVEVVLEYNGIEYVIRRGLNRIKGSGFGEDDYRKTFNMLEDDHVLPKEKAEEKLSSIFPVEISRFYLFDGELMAEYEKLLDPQNDEGGKIKESIEDLLGMPILTKGRGFLSAQFEFYNNEAEKIAGKNKRCKALVTKNASNRLILQQLKDTNTNLKKELDKLQKTKDDINSEMSKNRKLLRYITTKEGLVSNLKDQENNLKVNKEKLIPEINSSWKILISDVAKDKVVQLEEKYQKLSKFESVVSYSKLVLSLLKENEDKCVCPTCKTQIDSDTYARLIKSLESSISDDDRSIDELIPLKSRIEELKEISKNVDSISRKEKIDFLLSVVENINRDIVLTKGRIKDEELKIASEGSITKDVESNLSELPDKLSGVEKQITLCESAIADNEKKIKQMKSAIEDLEKRIASENPGKEYDEAKAKAKMVGNLHQLFEKSIIKFRDELTKSVERDASMFFSNITNQPEQYDHLEINDNFGLEIIHKEGIPVPNRSGGEEQIVAFSLLSALHKNAPIDGPIFMDSTFQRIDRGHQIKSAKSLLSFNTQIIIFAYKDEIKDIDDAYQTIGDKLIKEYTITKVGGDAFKSKIE